MKYPPQHSGIRLRSRVGERNEEQPMSRFEEDTWILSDGIRELSGTWLSDIVLGRNSRWVGPQTHARFRTWMSSSTDEERRRRNTVVVDTYGWWVASEKHNNSRMTTHPQLSNTHRDVQQTTNQLCSGSTPSVPALNVQAHIISWRWQYVDCSVSRLRAESGRTKDGQLHCTKDSFIKCQFRITVHRHYQNKPSSCMWST